MTCLATWNVFIDLSVCFSFQSFKQQGTTGKLLEAPLHPVPIFCFYD